MAQARIEAPVVVDAARPYTQGLPVGVVGAIGSRQLGVAVKRRGVGDHVDARSEGSGSVGACAGSALDLDVAQRRRQVGHVHPIDVVAL